MALSKICGHCGKVLRVGETCPCRVRFKQKRYDDGSRDPKKRAFYHSRAWVKCRGEVLKRDAYVDMYAYRQGRLIPATLVHHIETYEEHPEKALDKKNLISVSDASHAEIHKRYDTGDKEACQRELWEAIGAVPPGGP